VPQNLSIHRSSPSLFALTVLLTGSLISGPISHAQSSDLKLIPQPREISKESSLALTHGIRISVEKANAEDTFTEHDLESALAERSIAITQDRGQHAALIELLRADSAPAQKILKRPSCPSTPPPTTKAT
jgi:hypothetical protein